MSITDLEDHRTRIHDLSETQSQNCLLEYVSFELVEDAGQAINGLEMWIHS